ncbi:outer dense fiber protein 2-like isoform X2 [Cynoglossus semilaevis]|uniref:outer dense fiber protein 2-like isoform X2 n=1 Tax=Cynoglossus semilaevis TaxID=244447 RepID=UPI0007DCA569|nr:outer dense fiber protein 2-like isoform X2 [Cynoglossus semilaevis]
MISRDLTSEAVVPPPIHVHVPETTPVHVHMRRSPGYSAQMKTNGVQVKENGVKPKARSPWIPPGRLSYRRDMDSYKSQDQKVRMQRGSDNSGRGHKEEEMTETNLCLLLREQEDKTILMTSEAQDPYREPDALLRALVEAEIDGMAVTNQLSALKETVNSLTKEKRFSKCHTTQVSRQQKLLLDKIEMFDRTNQNLRQLLRDWSEQQKDWLLSSQHRNSLKKKLTESEAENTRLLSKLNHKEKEAYKLAQHLDFEKDTVKTTEELSKILESTRDHLESKLHRTEVEKSCLAAQIKKMHQDQEQQQQELQALQEELLTLRKCRDQEHERESELIRRAEETSRELAEKLHEKEGELAKALSSSSDWCLRHSREAAAKVKLEEEISTLALQVSEMRAKIQTAEERSRAEREELRDRLHHLSAENASTTLENNTLKAELTSSLEKLRGLQSEARELRTSIRKYESLVEKYKNKLQQSRSDADKRCNELQQKQQEVEVLQAGLDKEREQVRREMFNRLQELEIMPDKLRRVELQLRHSQQEADAHQRRNLEHSSTLSDLRHKVEQQGSQLEMSQERNMLLQEDNKVLKEKTRDLELKLEEMKKENREMSQTMTSQESSIHSLQQQMEERNRECSVLNRQLQHAVDDAQRQMDDNVQKVWAKERVSQSKALDLQSQLSRAKSELSQLQRSKEEMERRFQNQLQNMKERLEQSDSTNRTLQNYVQFLKVSYGNVFGDSLVQS